MFNKRIDELTKEDIQRVVAEAVLEDAEVKFKETLPAKDGKDPRIEGGNKIGDRARNEILEEIIAFANTYGGILFLGIQETEDKPARAKKILPIPRCVELAERLKLQCRDCIEPQIPIVEIVGVSTRKKDGAGVVVVQLPQSRASPHRHTVTRECYKRHADRTEKMTMREIQDLTLQVERGMGAIEAKFEERRRQFSQITNKFFGVGESVNKDPLGTGMGIRVSLVPLTPIFLDRVHNVDEVRPRLRSFMASPDFSNPSWRCVKWS